VKKNQFKRLYVFYVEDALNIIWCVRSGNNMTFKWQYCDSMRAVCLTLFVCYRRRKCKV